MTEVFWLLLAFVLLNVLDGYTTWLGLYALPEDLRGRESNVLFKDVEVHYWPAMIKKGILVLFGVWLLYRFANPYAIKVLDLAFVIVVLNNAYVYLSRRLSGKKTRSPSEYLVSFFQKLRLPEKVSELLGFLVLVGADITICYFIVGAIS